MKYMSYLYIIDLPSRWHSRQGGGGEGAERVPADHAAMARIFGLSVARTAPRGALAGLAHLGCTPETEQAW